MLGRERQNLILDTLNSSRTVRIPELTERFNVSVATIRRDLDILESEGLIRRIYGGAELAERKSYEQPIFNTRVTRHAAQKAAIGAAAAKLISEGDTVVLDIGTTTLEVAKNIGEISHLTVLTNSLPVLNELVSGNVNVYALGGRLRGQELSIGGSIAEETLGNFFVDKAFVGAGGVTLENGITDYSPDSAQLCSAIMKRANEVILVVDSSKFNKNVFAKVAPINHIDTVVTDSGIPQEYVDFFAKSDIRLIIADI